jgi:hypothetical protein
VTFSVPAGSEQQFRFLSGEYDGVLIVGVVTSASSNTTVSISEVVDPKSVGYSGVAAFIVDEGGNWTVNIYDGNMSGFSATVNVWFFHS